MKKPALAYILVFLQFSLLALLALLGNPLSEPVLRLLPQILAVALGVWAVAEMKYRVSVFPVAGAKTALIRSGPYACMRHPMYTTLLILSLSWIPAELPMNYFFILASFWVVLIVKMYYEELSLLAHVEGYREYSQRVARIIPFVY